MVAQFDAGELITQREVVSSSIDAELTKRAEQFGIILDDISITHLTFGREFTQAVELKQVSQDWGTSDVGGFLSVGIIMSDMHGISNFTFLYVSKIILILRRCYLGMGILS